MFCLFDLDGTLLDTLFDLGNSHNLILKERGLSEISIDEYRYLVGKGLRNLSQAVLKLKDKQFSALSAEEAKAAVEQHLQRFQEVYGEQMLQTTKPYNGIIELLHTLLNAGIESAVLSNKADPFTKVIIAHYFPDYPFLFVEGMNQKWPRKPDASFALKLCKDFGKKPSDTYFIGDTSTDMQTAKNAGFHAVGVTWGFRDRAELLSHGADFIVDTADELSELLLKQAQ